MPTKWTIIIEHFEMQVKFVATEPMYAHLIAWLVAQRNEMCCGRGMPNTIEGLGQNSIFTN